MTDLSLRASNEAAMAAALPWLRTTDETGAPVWSRASLYHALDLGIPIVTKPAVVAGDGTVTKPAVLELGFHANLRLLPDHPDYAAIATAAAQFQVEPATAQRAFAGSAVGQAVPEVISDRQFAQVLALDGIITQDEALAWAARGDLPDALEDALLHIPEADGLRFGARMLLSAATTYERHHPLVPTLGALLGRDAAALDWIWIRGAAL